jgi:hypothetical protein
LIELPSTCALHTKDKKKKETTTIIEDVAAAYCLFALCVSPQVFSSFLPHVGWVCNLWKVELEWVPVRATIHVWSSIERKGEREREGERERKRCARRLYLYLEHLLFCRLLSLTPIEKTRQHKIEWKREKE